MNTKKKNSDNGEAPNMLYVTSDHLSFLNNGSATRHAKQLEDKTIVTMTKAQAEQLLTKMTSDDRNNELEALLDGLTERNG